MKTASLSTNILDEQQIRDILHIHSLKKYHQNIDDAIDFTKQIHKDQKRLSGEKYYFHPLNVAVLVAQMKLDTLSIIVALLHNTLNSPDPKINNKRLELIEEKFGNEVSEMIQTINEFSNATRSASDSDTISRYILRSSEDLRLILIKLADRVHNARTIDSLSPKQQKKAATNLINIYSPLSSYLNLHDVKNELEEIAFRILKPNEYNQVDRELKDLDIINQKRKDDIYNFLSKEASQIDISDSVIYGRIKGHYRIFKKIKYYELHNRPSDILDIKDLIAFTVILNTEEECYNFALRMFKVGEVDLKTYDDYITNPKDNGYKSIHMNVRVPELSSKIFEVQFKTVEMHHYNIYGPASHIAYKGSDNRVSNLTSDFFWVKHVHKQIYNYRVKNRRRKSEPILSDIFANKIYVFTPKGELIEMPIGSTIIDFAYRIHDRVGNNTVGAEINGMDSHLSAILKNGDRIKILTNNLKKIPDREWLQFVRTRKAREAIETAHKLQMFNEDSSLTHVY